MKNVVNLSKKESIILELKPIIEGMGYTFGPTDIVFYRQFSLPELKKIKGERVKALNQRKKLGIL